MPSDAIQRIIDADEDAISFSGFVNEPSDELIQRRLAPPMNTLNYYRDFLQGLELVYSQQTGVVDVNGVQVKPVKVALDDALDAAVVGGGGLAATAVATVSQLTGAVARTQASKNSDVVSIKEFGDYGNGGDWTPALEKIAGKGIKVWLPEGHYKFRTDNIDCQSKDLIFEGNNAIVELINGTGAAVFNVTNCANVMFTNIKFTTADNTSRKLLTCTAESYIGNLDISDNDFIGNVVVIREIGSLTRLPVSNPYGFKKITYKRNKSSNMNATHFSLVNYPVYSSYITDNEINNFSFVYLYFGITNGSANETELKKINKYVAKRNTATNDDDYWHATGSSQYYCFLLAEGYDVRWENNDISGMKADKSDISLYDAYLSCMNVVSRNNIYKNNANFNASNTNNWLIKAKQDSLPDLKAVKIFDTNTYVIEKSWLDRIGKQNCSHKLFGLGVLNAGSVTISNLTIDIDIIDGELPYICEYVHITNNNIRGRDVKSAGEIIRPFPFNDQSIANINRNNTYISQLTTSANFISNVRSTPLIWGSFSFNDNDFIFRGTGGITLMYAINATNASIEKNRFDGLLVSDFFDCTFKNLVSKGNTYKGSTVGGSRLLRECEFSGTSNFNANLIGIVKDFYLYLPNPLSSSAPERFKVSASFESASGVNSVVFEYTLSKNASNEDIITLLRKNETLPTTLILEATQSDTFIISSTGVGDAVSVYARLYNNSRFIRIVGVDGFIGEVNLSIKSFYI